MTNGRLVAVLASAVAAVVVAVGASCFVLGDSRESLRFTMTYELMHVGSVDDSLRDGRSIIRLEWNGEGNWKRTVLLDDGRADGSWQASDGTSFQMFDATSGEITVEELEPGVTRIPEVWFAAIGREETKAPVWEPLPGLALYRRRADYRAECPESSRLLCVISENRDGRGVEETIRDADGIPVSFSDTFESIVITKMSVLILEKH
jgi:hypothetical protein